MKLRLTIFTLLVFTFSSGKVTAEDVFKVVRSEEGLEVTEAGKPVLFYQIKTKSSEGKYSRANYIHPLYSLDGGVLTEDFPADHLHHRGVFWAWHTLTVDGKYAGDNWECKDFDWDLKKSDVLPDEDASIAIQTTWLWKSPKITNSDGSKKPVVEEQTTVRVFSRQTHYRLVDFEIRLKALLDEVRLAGSLDDKGYGGFSARIHRPKDMIYTGEIGEVIPNRLAVDGGSWMDMSGSLTGKGKSGLTILCHPSLPTFPQKWLLRRGAQQNPQWPGSTPYLLPKGKDVILRYRLVIHDDSLTAEGIKAIQGKYAEE